MSRSQAGLVLAAALVLLLPGCIVAAGAAVGAGVVYAVTEDTVRVDVRAGRDDVVQEVERLLEEKGEVTSSLRASGIVEADVRNSSVNARVFTIGDFVRVRVKARRVGGVFPNLDLAREIATEVRHAFP